MLKAYCRWLLFVPILLATIWTVTSNAADAMADLRAFNIAAQPMPTALQAFAAQAHVQLLFDYRAVKSLTAPAVKGRMNTTSALAALLNGSGLTFQQVNSRTVAIRSTSEASKTAPSSPRNMPIHSPQTHSAAGDPPTGEPSEQTSGPETQSLAVIVVTAERRREPLQEVPVPDTVLNTGALADNAQSRLADYFATVPGLSFQNSGGGFQSLSIRGISTSLNGNPTVAVLIDGVPFGSTQALAEGSLMVPDIDPSDLQRIEVLRGPQGTLYGADSIGGLINYVTEDPSLTGMGGHVQLLGEAVDHGETGEGVSGTINIPVTDTIAVRANAFARRDPGYIDDVTTGQHYVNRADVAGGMLSALWRPTENLSLKLLALLQNTNADGSAAVDTDGMLRPISGLQQTGLPGNGKYDTRVRLYSATLSADLGALSFKSITGYGINRNFNNADSSGIYGPFAQTYFGVPAVLFPQVIETRKFTQEFSLSSPTDQRLEWLVGAFYTSEKSPYNQTVYAFNPATDAQLGQLVDFYFPSGFSESALFGDLTVHLTRRFDVQFGGRESENRQTFNETDSGLLVPLFDGVPSPYVQPTEHIRGSAFTYLVTPRFKISPELMVYMRAASGYRAGGPNEEAALFQLPLQYSPDRAYDYELGAKGEFLDHKLIFDASVYYIDWQRLQIQVSLPPDYSIGTINAGSAKSEGLELAIQAYPAPGLVISANTSVNDAELTQAFPPTSLANGDKGARLPYSIPISANFTAEQDIVHVDGWTGLIGAAFGYIGRRKGDFAGSGVPRFELPGYATVDLHIGVRSDLWHVNLFVNNLTDRLGILGGSNDFTFGTSGYSARIIQPRTVGLSLARHF